MAFSFTTGDEVALLTLAFGLFAWAIREYRASVNMKVARAAADAALKTIVDSVLERISEAMEKIGVLDDKRQAHELECARINERTTANQKSTAEILERQGRDIESLQAQMSHVASGAANTVRELPPIRRK